ncbi:MAG: peptidoglycan DD-metalloendopeptidase family protein, partial [Gemmatimonadales bacterium]
MKRGVRDRCPLLPSPRSLLPVLYAAAVLGCNGPLDSAFSSGSPHEQYAASLEAAGLDATELGNAWLEAGEDATRKPVAVSLPFRETGYIPETEPQARGYRVTGREGQVLVVELDSVGTVAPRIFLDLFIASADTSFPERIASADSGEYRIERELEEDADYIVRLQTELLR